MSNGVTDTILKIAQKKAKFSSTDVLGEIQKPVSRQYVSRIINNFVKSGYLTKEGTTKNSLYFVKSKSIAAHISLKLVNKSLQEHEVLNNIEAKVSDLSKLPEEIKNIFQYTFTEMLNNAIEHSKSNNIEIEVFFQENNLHFIVKDSGIGVFRNIMKKFNLTSELDAIQDLIKGKTTTDRKSHTGEGIFFTSKAADVFLLESFGFCLKIDNNIDDIFIETPEPSLKGTRVEFIISMSSQKHLTNIFQQFQSSPLSLAFDKTEIKVKLYALGTVYISRSQARRLLVGLDKFKLIILDFDQVRAVGQAFADEIFRVFTNMHPEVQFKPINMNKTVDFMIKRARAESSDSKSEILN